MSKYTIEINDNKIIFDGHADDLKTCEAITDICNSLSITNKTIEYKDGYAEFEINPIEEVKFPPIKTYSLYNNNGTTLLVQENFSLIDTWVIEPHKISPLYDGELQRFWEDENTTIIGMATSPNQTVPTYGIGTHRIEPGSDSEINFYLVQETFLGSKYLDKGGLTHLWNELKTKLTNKQDKLNTQMAYSSIGTSTTVPQISTNTYGQVTNISEVAIALPTKVSDLTNDSGFITSSYHDSTKQNVLTAGDNITIEGNVISASSIESYNDLTNKPKVNNIELSGNKSLSDLGIINFSGNYNDLTNKPVIPTVNDGTLTIQRNGVNLGSFSANTNSNKTFNVTVPVNLSDLTADATHRTVSDVEKSTWNAKSNFSGDYNDLTNKPTIPTVNDATLTVKRNNISVGTFTANQSEDQSIDIDVPVNTSDLTNDSNFIADADYVHTDNNYTTAEKTKLSGLTNYDDTVITQEIAALQNSVNTIEGEIPTQASSSNQLADKAFVNSTIQTATANFRGNWATWSAVPSDSSLYPEDYQGVKTPSSNDYLVVQDASGYTGQTLEGTWRFKYLGEWSTAGKNGWRPEYQVNETPMTAVQLAALNSGATSELIGQISTNATNITNLQNSKQDTLVGGSNIKNIYNGDASYSLIGGGTLNPFVNVHLTGTPVAPTASAGTNTTQIATTAFVNTAIGNVPKVWYATSSTGAVIQTKVASTTNKDFVLATGAQATILMTNANLYNGIAKLNIDNTGDKDLIPYSGATTTRYFWKVGEAITVVYNGTSYIMVDSRIADTTYYGITKLSSATDSTATDLAATPSAVKAAYDLAYGKQDKLTSGTNIKTINNQSILGSGNITISSGGQADDITTRLNTSNETEVIGIYTTQNNARKIWEGTLAQYNALSTKDSDTYYYITDDDVYQEKLISGTNIKTINNQSILGSGNIDIQGGGGNVDDVLVNGTSVVTNKVANVTVPTATSDLTNDSGFITAIPNATSTTVGGIKIGYDSSTMTLYITNDGSDA